MPAKSIKQQRFMGMVHAYQTGKLPGASPEVKKVSGGISKKDAKDFASTKHKKLPEKVAFWQDFGRGLINQQPPESSWTDNIGSTLGAVGGIGLSAPLLNGGSKYLNESLAKTIGAEGLSMGRAARRGAAAAGRAVSPAVGQAARSAAMPISQLVQLAEKPLASAQRHASLVQNMAGGMNPLSAGLGHLSSAMKQLPTALGVQSPMLRQILRRAARPRNALAALLAMTVLRGAGGAAAGDAVQKRFFGKKSAAELTQEDATSLVEKAASLADKVSTEALADYVDCVVILNPALESLTKFSTQLRKTASVRAATLAAYPKGKSERRMKLAAKVVLSYLRSRNRASAVVTNVPNKAVA